ncbi:MAG: outer membrane receptor protein involved in Fe transport [Myxococcota bacterium]|jgi:outer membrane receptor protein involved in Fe transport
MIALLLASLAWADEPEPVDPFEEADESELFALDEQLVTVASRYAQTVQKAPNIVTLVTADMIRERGYRTVTDILRDMPGLYASKSSEGRDLVTFRGIVSPDNNKILLLVDGVAWYDGVYTHAFTGDFLPVSQIRQVEVIKGPGSAVYGTGAFAGVVNIVTYAPGEVDGVRAHWTLGGRNRSDVSVMAGTRTRAAGLDIGVSATARILTQDGDGIDITPRGERDLLGQDPKRGAFIAARLDLEGLTLGLEHTDYRHSFLTNPAATPTDIIQRDIDNYGLFYHYTTIHARYDIDVANRVTVTPRVWSHRYDNPGSYFFDAGFTTVERADGTFDTTQSLVTVETNKDTRRLGFAVDMDARPVLDHVTVAGTGAELTRIIPGPDDQSGVLDLEFQPGDIVGRSTGFEASGGLLNVYAYAQHTWTALPELEFVLGARYDQRFPVNSSDDPGAGVFQPTATPRAGVLLVPSDAVTVKVLYGRAFRAPNVRELLVKTTERDEDDQFVFAAGRLDLRPESIDTVEAEITAKPMDGLELRALGSWSLVTNEIDKISPPNEYQNLAGNLSVVAAEAEATLTYAAFTARVAYALTLSQYGSQGPYAGRQQFEVPPHMVKASLTGRLGERLSSTVLAEVYSARPRSDWAPTVGLEDGPAYALVHVSGRASDLGPGERFGVGFSIRNASNTQYQTPVYRDEVDRGAPGDPRFPRGIQAEGRAVFATVDVDL